MPWAAFSLCCQGAEASMPVAETKAPILLQTLGGQAGPGVWCAGRGWGAALGRWLSRCSSPVSAQSRTVGGGREGIQLGNRKPPTRGYSQASGPPHPAVQSEGPRRVWGAGTPAPSPPALRVGSVAVQVPIGFPPNKGWFSPLSLEVISPDPSPQVSDHLGVSYRCFQRP